MIGQRKLLSNSLSLLVNRLTQSITSFILIAAIARLLGTHELGQYLLASSYYLIFMTLTAQGLKVLLIRELSRSPENAPTYLVSGSILQFFCSVVGYLGLVFCVIALPYSAQTTFICCLLGLMIIPFSLWNVTESIFQSRDQMHLITLSVTPIYIIRLVVSCWGMLSGFGIIFVAETLIVAETLVWLFQWFLVMRIVSPSWKIDWDFIRSTINRARTLMALEGFSMLSGRAQIIILSLFVNELAVGIYGGISQIVQPFQIVAASLVSATFPSLSRSAISDFRQQKKVLQGSVSILLSIAIPCVIGTFFLGKDLLIAVYKDSSFTDYGVEFSLISLGMVAASFIQPLGSLLVANNFERINLREVIITGVCNMLISIVLIWKYNLMGAAATTVISGFIGLAQYVYSVNFRLFKLDLIKIFLPSLILGSTMFIVFWILKTVNLNFVYSILLASSVYACLLVILFLFLFKKKHYLCKVKD